MADAHDRLAEIVDALEPGGSGDPFVSLTAIQRDALAALYGYGFPRGAECSCGRCPLGRGGFHASTQSDPGYYEGFWSTPGYLGHDDSGRFAAVRITTTATVRTVIAGKAPTDIGALADSAGAVRDHSVGIVLDGAFDDREALSRLPVTFTSGEYCPEMFDGAVVGDECTVDNRDSIAWCHLAPHARA